VVYPASTVTVTATTTCTVDKAGAGAGAGAGAYRSSSTKRERSRSGSIGTIQSSLQVRCFDSNTGMCGSSSDLKAPIISPRPPRGWVL
jgi:hypothetical protein